MNAANRTRTCDMLVNSQPLYQLSYGGTRCALIDCLRVLLKIPLKNSRNRTAGTGVIRHSSSLR
jgi:hypothetical protein